MGSGASKAGFSAHYKAFIESDIDQGDRKLMADAIKAPENDLSTDFFKAVMRIMKRFREKRAPLMDKRERDKLVVVDCMGMLYFAVLSSHMHIRCDTNVIPVELAALFVLYMGKESSVTIDGDIELPSVEDMEDKTFRQNEKKLLSKLTDGSYPFGTEVCAEKISEKTYKLRVVISKKEGIQSGKTAGFNFHDKVKTWPNDKYPLPDLRDNINAFLGKGTYGEVYRVRDFLKLGDVACKIYFPPRDSVWSMSDSVTNEVDNWIHAIGGKIVRIDDFKNKTMKNPNLIPLFGLYEANIYKKHDDPKDFDKLCLIAIMPLMSGSLSMLYETFAVTHGKTILARAVFEAAKGLQQLHKQDMLHGDLKNDNMLYRNDGGDNIEVYISDFGSARRLLNDEEGNATMLVNYYPWREGTRTYWPYEIVSYVRDGLPDDAEREKYLMQQVFKKDIYGLGCTIMKILKGKKAFDKMADWIYRDFVAVYGVPNTDTKKMEYYMFYQKNVINHRDFFADLPRSLKKILAIDPEDRPNINAIVESMQVFLDVTMISEKAELEESFKKALDNSFFNYDTIIKETEDLMNPGEKKEKEKDSDDTYGLGKYPERQSLLKKRFKQRGSSEEADAAMAKANQQAIDDDDDEDGPVVINVVCAQTPDRKTYTAFVKTVEDVFDLPKNPPTLRFGNYLSFFEEMSKNYEATVITKAKKGVLPSGNQLNEPDYDTFVQLKHNGKPMGQYQIGRGSVVLSRVIPSFNLLVVLTKVGTNHSIPLSSDIDDLGDGFGTSYLVFFDYKKKQHVKTVKANGYYVYQHWEEQQK